MIATLTNGVHYDLTSDTLMEDVEPMADFSEAMTHARKTASDFNYLSARAHIMFEASKMGGH